MKIKSFEPQKVVSITMRNNVNFVAPTCAYVESLVTRIGMSEEKTKLVLAHVENVLKKRIETAYYDEGDITLDVLVGLDRIIFQVKDQGIPYWIDVEEAESSPYRADRYQLEIGTDGQCFSMRFYLEPGADADAYEGQDAPEEELLDSNLHIRRALPNEKDIVEVLRCIHSNYGYGYINRSVYDMNHMKAILEEESQWSYLGYNDHDQIMAHMSVAFYDELPGICEIGGLVCKPYCRGHNVANRLNTAVCKDVEISGVNGVFGMAVAFHDMSQRIALKQGLIPTGVMLHYMVPESAGEYRDGNRRQECCLCARLFTGKTYKLSAPVEHQEFIRSRYQKMGCDCEFVEPAELSGLTDFTVAAVNEIRMGKIFIENANHDFEKKLKGMMKDFVRNQVEMVEVFVNMNNPSAANIYEMLKRKGFSFSGILPGSEKGEYMVMQHLMKNPVEWDKIVTAGEFTEVINYIRAAREKQMAELAEIKARKEQLDK